MSCTLAATSSRHLEAGRVEAIALVLAHQLEQRLLLVQRPGGLQLVKGAQVEENALLEVATGVLVHE